VWVPEEAGNGYAKVTLSFPDCRNGAVTSATFNVLIEELPTASPHWGLYVFGASLLIGGCVLFWLMGLVRGWGSGALVGMLVGALATQAAWWFFAGEEDPNYWLLFLGSLTLGGLAGLLTSFLPRRHSA
jgi:hypothetical protein